MGKAARILAVLAAVSLSVPAAAAPQRVVSANICTDQLAMLIAGEGQLHSVSHVSLDPNSSAMVEQAAGYAVNHGLAEEIFLMKPDLVLAGTYTTRATVDMLERLGFRVELFAPEASFADLRANMLRMGDLLGREARAAELVAELDAGLAELAADAVPDRMVATYSANSYTSGPGTLPHAAIEAAGVESLAETLGISGIGKLPLEMLVLARPQVLVSNDDRQPAPALAQQNFVHPAFRAALGDAAEAAVPDSWWICGGPFTLAAAKLIQDAARAAPPRAQ